nr:flagellar biosynthetic protein FliR [uncultured Faecalimonas sp.]
MQIGDTAHLTLFSLILMRMSGFILFNPIFGRRNIPTIVKSSMIFILTVAVYSFSRETAFVVESPVEYYMLLLKEFAAGYVLGLVADLFFMVISFAGYIIDFQMGMSMATVYDPQSNSQMAITGNVMQTFFVLLFFAVDGHLALMKILLTSAEIVPYGGFLITKGLAWRVVEIFMECMSMGVKFSMPILAAEFLVEIGVGILNKVVPQISIFIINIQLKIIVGMGLLVILFSPVKEYLEQIMSTMIKTLQGMLTFF